MRLLYATFGVLLFSMLFAGCTSQHVKQSVDRENSHLRWLVKLYLHASRQGLVNNESDFRQFIAGLSPEVRDKTLDGAGVQNMDELFVSERDGKPFIVLYGSAPKAAASGIVAFEQEGADGKRYIGFALGMIEEVDESRFNELVPKAALSQK